MGLNSFFATCAASIAAIAGVTYLEGFQAGLCIILIEGVIFLGLSLLNVREKIVDAIPYTIRMGIAPAIGLMLVNIGFGSNAGIYNENGECFYMMRDFFGALTSGSIKEQLGTAWTPMVITVITVFVGLFLMVGFKHWGVKGNVLLGMVGASVFFWACQAIFMGVNPFAGLENAQWLPAFGDMAELTLFKFNFGVFAKIGVSTIITLVITFCIIDMFDTIGTVLGTASKADMLDEKGNMPKMKEALTADAVGTIVGGCTGTSTITTFIESASGVEAGGRTGLTAVVTGLMFLVCMFISPIAAIIPSGATSAALVYVGILMLQNLNKIRFDDIESIVPASIMLLAMPISGSIGNSIGLAMITYCGIKTLRGKVKQISALTWIITAIFILKFFVTI